MKKNVEMWLPTSEMKVTVVEGVVTVWEEMTMEKKVVKKPAGFAPLQGAERQAAIDHITAPAKPPVF